VTTGGRAGGGLADFGQHLLSTSREGRLVRRRRQTERFTYLDPGRAGWNPGRAGVLASSQDLLDDLPVHVGEPAVDAIMPERQAGVVDSEEVEDGGVQVVAIRDVFDGLV
jgi:hypothetical protein